jgi:predicted ATPase
MKMSKKGIPHIEKLHIKNYRVLHDIEFNNLSAFSVFLGPNGSGKSTIFDVFAFLSECFDSGLRKAWDKRGRFKELRTRGAYGPIEFELKYREKTSEPLMTYHLSIDEEENKPFIAEEWLKYRRGSKGQPYKILDYQKGIGSVISGETPEKDDKRIDVPLTSKDVLAVSTLGQLAENPRVAALRQFISDWYLSYLSANNTRTTPDAGPQERISSTGDNLPNVIQYLREQHPKIIDTILDKLSSRIPRLEKVEAEFMADGRLLLKIKDKPFDEPILSKYASDGTLKMLAYLTILYDPNPPELIGIEEPENHLHPRLLRGLAEECRLAARDSQLLVTTHSPYFVNGLIPKELWILYRDKKGHTKVFRASEIPGIIELVESGGLLGKLWLEGHFGVGDPLDRSGEPTQQLKLAFNLD